MTDPEVAWQGVPPGTVIKMLAPLWRRATPHPFRAYADHRMAVAISSAHSLGLAATLPSLDDVVRVWLATAADALGSAGGLSPRDAASVRVVRRLRNQIHEITPCLPLVRSRAVADELRVWIGLRPALLADLWTTPADGPELSVLRGRVEIRGGPPRRGPLIC